MKTLFTLLIMLGSAGNGLAQLPGNFNLVANGKFQLNPDEVFLDTTFSGSACWTWATKPTVTQFIVPGSAYWRQSDSLFHFDFNNWNTAGGRIFSPDFKYSRSTGIIIDSFLNGHSTSYMHNKLLEPLQANTDYRFSMHVLALRMSPGAVLQGAYDSGFNYSSLHAIKVKNIGVHFSTSRIAQYSVIGRLNLTPQLNFKNWVGTKEDTLELIELTGTYHAAGGEQFITIGYFDYVKDFVIVPDNYPSNYGDTIGMSANHYVTDVSVVRDTTLPMISLDTFDIGPDTIICPGTPLTIGGKAGYFSYSWNTSDTTRLLTVSQPGTYWCIADFGCGSHTDTDTVHILPPLPIEAFNIPDTGFCAGSSFIATAPPGYTAYSWSNSATTQTAAINTAGIHWAQISRCGQSYTDTFQLSLVPSVIPGININTVPPIFLCSGTPITFVTNNTGAGSNPQYQWYKNNILIPGAISSTYLDAALLHADTLTVRMYSSATCPTTYPTVSNKVGVTVSPVLATGAILTASPGTNIQPGQPVTFTAAPVNGGGSPVYTWFLNGIVASAGTGPVWTSSTLNDGDVVKVRMESAAPCPAPALVYSNTLVMRTKETGITTTGREGAVSIYPNPVKKELNIRFQNPVRSAGITITDLYGRVLISQHVLNCAAATLDLTALAPGIYTWGVLADGVLKVGKLVKE